MTTEDCGNPPNAQEPQAELSLCATLQTVELTVMQSPIGPGAHPPGPPGSEAEASPKGIVLSHDHDFVAVDFIGGDEVVIVGRLADITGCVRLVRIHAAARARP